MFGAVFWAFDPVRFRLIVFQPAREVRLVAKELEPLSSWVTVRRTNASPTRELSIDAMSDDQVDVVADLWTPDATQAVKLGYGLAKIYFNPLLSR